MKMTVFWDIALIALMMEAVSTSETSVYFYGIIRRYIPEDCHLQIVRVYRVHKEQYITARTGSQLVYSCKKRNSVIAM
jgi:hypothetical protein